MRIVTEYIEALENNEMSALTIGQCTSAPSIDESHTQCHVELFSNRPEPSVECDRNWHGSDMDTGRRWYALFTLPQNEKAVARHLHVRNVQAFLPTYEAVRIWKNRQRVKSVLPLFPTYLFVLINASERLKVLQCPGVLQILGNGRTHTPLAEAEIEILRSGLRGRQVEPYRELILGERVRVKAGIMQGLDGFLVRKNDSLRFVLAINSINQYAAVEVDADVLETAVA